jgi:hypothetical protein
MSIWALTFPILKFWYVPPFKRYKVWVSQRDIAMNEKERWLSNLFSTLGGVFGLLIAFGLLFPLHIQSDSMIGLIPFLGLCVGGVAGHWLSRNINAAQFHEGLGRLFCSVGKHWYGPDRRSRSNPPIGGFECWRCGFRPDGGKPRFLHHS